MDLLPSGRFSVGCNYWASHAGTQMWSDWHPEVVDDDFRRLAEYRITTLRVFPLWPDFQPITLLRGGAGTPREYRFGEAPLDDKDGMCGDALDHFRVFCDLAAKHGLRLIVGLLTGWMSGRLFVPPALEGRNVLTDPVALMWETRFVRRFVKRFRDHPSICAWDLGNECNVMGSVNGSEQFYVWTSLITDAIRSCDSTRPVVSGMHGLLPDKANHTIQHQAELTDYLTTHPYPYFTPHCDMDPIDTIRTIMHATAETLFYGGIGGKPCFVEECGTLGPMFADEDTAARFVRANLFSLWAHDCRAFLWWCANEQIDLTHAPYDWNSVERELGLFRRDKSPKPVLLALRDFAGSVAELGPLPPRITDGVCILTRGQDTWGAAYMTFILAKKAGIDLTFVFSDEELPEAPLYLLPSICGDSFMTGRRFSTLLEKVRNGAALYLSLESGLLSPFAEFSGVRVRTRRKVGTTVPVTLEGDRIPLHIAYGLALEPVGATVLATTDDATPVYTVHDHGSGKVFFLAAPLETGLTRVSNAFDASCRYDRFYAPLKAVIADRKVARVGTPNVGLTEHIIDDRRRRLVLVNYEPFSLDAALSLDPGWAVDRWLLGAARLSANDGAVVDIVRGGTI